MILLYYTNLMNFCVFIRAKVSYIFLISFCMFIRVKLSISSI
ncbi:hypothetical protein ENHY17A_210003 [Moraxellaceae bacterium 17A]|nr:hypothetical protein ENHY17A_210003 [Moraxellaceae bacterium 17A]